jgi:DNA-binding NarL/FixJ family response regulator
MADAKFDARAVARGLEVFQSTMPPEGTADQTDTLHVLMHAGSAKAATQLQHKLGEAARVDWDEHASHGSIDSLLQLALGSSTLHSRVVALIDARWVDDAELERWHRSHPLMPVVIVAREEGIATLRAMSACVARGLITPGCSIELLAQAVEAVSRGDLWMAPPIVPYLYACMLAHTASIRETAEPAVPAAAAPPSLSAAESASTSHLGLLSEAALTPREIAAIELARTGYTNKEIAKSLGISDNTVKKHLANAFDKLGIHRRRQLY